jgi:hypothetical protein
VISNTCKNMAERFQEIYREKAMMNGGIQFGGVAIQGGGRLGSKCAKKKTYRKDGKKYVRCSEFGSVPEKKKKPKAKKGEMVMVPYKDYEKFAKCNLAKTDSGKDRCLSRNGSNNWIWFLKAYSVANNIKYSQAISDPGASYEYRSLEPNELKDYIKHYLG